MRVSFRVAQWATGNVGRAAVEAIISHPELELVGAWVHSEDKAGRDVGEICGLPPLGVRASTELAEIVALKPDCVLYAPLLPNQQEVAALLEAGVNVVTPLNWFYPGQRDVDAVRSACERGGVTLHGTGIHPGGITERLPLTIAALSREVTHVRAEEFSDIRSYGAVDVTIEVTGDPSIKTTFQGLHPESVEVGLARNPGIVATAVHCVSAIPYVCRAEPGIKTYLDLPLVTGRAAPSRRG